MTTRQRLTSSFMSFTPSTQYTYWASTAMQVGNGLGTLSGLTSAAAPPVLGIFITPVGVMK